MTDASVTIPVTYEDAWVQLAELLGNPMPADWRDPQAIQARRDHVAAVAHLAGHAMLDGVVRFKELQDAALPFPSTDPCVAAFGAEMVALDRAMRSYTYQTQRGDVLDVVQKALEGVLGAAAPLVMGIVHRMREL
jgi:hypothetical protein